MPNSPPQFPAGELMAPSEYDAVEKLDCIRRLEQAPHDLRSVVSSLSANQLDTRYRNWTIRQIVHHVADSHVHSYIRFKWALTEDVPTIKAYEEADWVQLTDSVAGEVEPALALLDGLHAKWCQLLEGMTEEQFGRAFVHPQSGETVRLWTALNYYPWHATHHTAQISWVRNQCGWT